VTAKCLRVLLVEDSPSDAKLVLREIRAAGHAVEFERVEDAPAMRAALTRQGWDVVISDWSMPKFSALAALTVMKTAGLDLPFLIVSGTVGEDLAVEAMRAGAHDYVLKDKLVRLAPALERELREHQVREAHRTSEQALRASEARFSRLTQSGIIGVVVGDLFGNILEANEAFLAIVGYPRAALMAGELRWQDLAEPASRLATELGLEELRAGGIATPHEEQYVRKDGSQVAVLVGMATFDTSRLIAFMVDLTPQKRAEEALRHSEEQLRQAQKMEAVGRLAGGIAHDFNNLLSVILSYSEMLVEQFPVGDPRRDDLAEIGKAGQRGADLTRQLLMFSRQEVVEPRVLDLDVVLAQTDKMLQRIVGEDVDIVYVGAPTQARVRADPGHIEQVIVNLVVNARDAMPGGGKLTVEMKNVVLGEAYAREHLGIGAGKYVMLAVSDTGMGMDRQTQKRIFEPFFTTKERGKGTGLGLSTVFGIVQQCGGGIWVSSEPGHGTTFKVYLPRVEAQTDATPTPEAQVAPLEALVGSETILLVEDEDQIRAVARGILRKQGYHVMEAGNGDEALLQSKEFDGTIDLLVTDVVMPKMGGIELAERLAQSRPTMKVLCMSGYTDDALVRHGAMKGSIAYLQKPITPEKLARRVRRLLDAG
jgi:two-component system cell cycle sensor histidine kinase/response regulator CckA